MPDVWADETEKLVSRGAVIICLGILILLLVTGNASEEIIEAMIFLILLLSFVMIIRRGLLESRD